MNNEEFQNLVLQQLKGFNDQFNKVNEKLIGMDDRLDKIDARLDKMDSRLDSLEKRQAKLEANQQALENNQLALENNQLKLEMKIENEVVEKLRGISDGFELRGDQIERSRNDIEEKLDNISQDINYLVRKSAQNESEIMRMKKAK
jgi:chromosome segregation ATPase